MGISASTGKTVSKPPSSKLCDHHKSSSHSISPYDFSILPSCSLLFELLLRESPILVLCLQPCILINPILLTLHNLSMSCMVSCNIICP